MTVQLFIPYTQVLGNGAMTATSAPTVDSIPSTPAANQNLILTGPVGTFAAGAYQWVTARGRWQFLVDYQTICSQLFGVSEGYLCFPNTGDNLLPIGGIGQAICNVYRNGARITTYTTSSLGVTLSTPAAANDLYLIILISPLTAVTPISVGSGGISDAPNDGNAYVRKSLAWENIQSELNEGIFTGT